jgi:L-ascorbate metabolism protein UlaG (beta-lactamase superfamily)
MAKSTLQISYVGHTTVLIRLGALSILTDPNFSNRACGYGRRLHAPGIAPQALPPLSAILLSGADYDRLDLFSYKYFKTTTPLMVPKGLGKYLRKFLSNPITEIAPRGFHRAFDVAFHAIPSEGRNFRLMPLRLTAAADYLIESPAGNVYFSGGAVSGEQLKKTAARFVVDVALLPVHPHPSQKSKKRHALGPQEAVAAMDALKARYLIPLAWGTFSKKKADPEELFRELKRAVKEAGAEHRIRILRPGETFTHE